jgi:steroid delta-isomerase-like uncharacterized protein
MQAQPEADTSASGVGVDTPWRALDHPPGRDPPLRVTAPPSGLATSGPGLTQSGWLTDPPIGGSGDRKVSWMESQLLSPAEVAAGIFDAVQRRDLDALARLQHDDVDDDFVAVDVYRGKPAVRAFFEELFAAIPDFTLTTERILADGEHATVQWRITGTFAGGPFLGVHATGRPVELRGIDVMHVVDGLLSDNTIYYDMLSFARQIGMLPSAGSRSDRAMTAAFNAQTGLRGRLTRFQRSRN